MITQTLRDSAEKMWQVFTGTTSYINHSGVKGESRERIIKDFLREYLPKKFSITSGIIISAEGGQSRQQDIIIYDAFTSPVLCTDQVSLIPIESVYATIEVKSTLSKAELQKSVDNIKSVKELKHNSILKRLSQQKKVNSPAGFVFTFTADAEIKNYINQLDILNKEVSFEQQLSLLSILDRGSIFNVNKRNILEIVTFPSFETSLSYNGESGDKGENLMFFYLFLMTALNISEINPPDMTVYASKSTIHSFRPKINIPKELIKQDMYINLQDIGVLRLGDIPQLSNYSQKFFMIIQNSENIKKSLEKGFPEYFLFLYYTYAFFKQSPSLLSFGNYSFLKVDGDIITGFFGELYNWDEFSKSVPIFEKQENGVKLSKDEEGLIISNFNSLFQLINNRL